MKIRTILLLSGLFLGVAITAWIKKSRNSKLINVAEALTGSNVFYYKGGYGVIADNLYIHRDDTTNNIYEHEQCQFRGEPKNVIQLIKIEQNPLRFIPNKNIPKIQIGDNSIYILFTPNEIFVIDYKEGTFGKYPRDIGKM